MNIYRKKGLLLILIVFFVSCQNKNVQQTPTGRVTKGVFFIDMFEEGELGAVNSINISSPSIPWRFGGNMKISYIVRDGADVNAGDTVIIFDPTDVNRAIVDAQGRL